MSENVPNIRTKSSLNRGEHLHVEAKKDIPNPKQSSYIPNPKYDTINAPTFKKKSLFKRVSTALFGEDTGHSLVKSVNTNIVKPRVYRTLYDCGRAILANVFLGEEVAKENLIGFGQTGNVRTNYSSVSTNGGTMTYRPRGNSDIQAPKSVTEYQHIHIDEEVVYASGQIGDGLSYAEYILDEIRKTFTASNPDPRDRWITAQTVAAIIRDGNVAFNANNWGWDDLSGAKITRDSIGGYLIVLPGMKHRNR